MSFFSDKRKGFIQLVIIIGFIILSVTVSKSLQSQRPTTQSNDNQDRSIFVEITQVAPQQHQIQFETTGTVESLADIDVVPQVSGQIITFNDQFFEGGQFEKGEILFEIDPRDFILEVERLEAEVARAATSLTLEQAESAAAISEWQQFNGDKKIPDLVARKPQMAEAEANLRAAKAQLKSAKLDLERTKVAMPFNGRVLSSIVANGRFVSAGQSVGQVFDMDALEVRSSLTDQQLKWLLDRKDADITITADHLTETKIYSGFLKRSNATLNPATRFATASFGFENADGVLPGTFVTINVKGATLQNITKIPSSAVQKGNIFWAVDNQSRLFEIDPRIIYVDDGYIAASGINGNINIVTSRLDGGIAGMKVSRSTLQGEGQ